jgi:hypothetical protein
MKNFKFRTIKQLHIIVVLYFVIITVNAQDMHDCVKGNLIQFNDNGAWCWYQDERAVVDLNSGKLIIGSVASGAGTGGPSRDGHIESIIFDLNSRLSQKYIFMNVGCDDHNTPAFLVRPDGQYLTMYAQHYDVYSRYRIYDGNSWSVEQLFDWNSIPGGTDFSTTYSNLFYISAEDKIYNFVRCYARSPNMMVSTDQGDTWTYGGLLTQPDENIGYVNGYFKYAGNGIDRIDFICTEHHPRDYNTSIYHGYIYNGRSYTSDGIVLDSIITDKKAPNPSDFTSIFAANTIINDALMTRCWTIDIATYGNGVITALFQVRVNDDPNNPSDDPDHAFFFARYDGFSWKSTYLGQAGKKMYSSEQDYTGLGALHPNNPNVIYISTPFDPRDNTDLVLREIFKGTTSDNGLSWTWTQITQNSTVSNFRPIVPAWDSDHTALLWWRGTYSTAQRFDAAVVGIIEQNGEPMVPKYYLDADPGNTKLSDDSPLITTGPDNNQGAADNMWHERTGFGNGESVLTPAEIGGENAPLLKTSLVISDTGIFDIWVNFWANPDYDWRIKAGLSADNLNIFRQMASKQVEYGDHCYPLVLSESENTFLYQAYLGRVRLTKPNIIEVFVDDEAIETGTTNNLIGNITRTWYDGISYANLSEKAAISISEKALDFGTVLTDSSKTDSVLVLNSGNDSLWINSILSTNPRFAVSSGALMIAPAQSKYIFVSFTPLNNSHESGDIILTHNAPGSPDTIFVTGEGIGPEAVQDNSASLPFNYSLQQNYPNPFNPTTRISFSLEHFGYVTLVVYDQLGREIKILIDDFMNAGTYTKNFNATGLTSGIYFYRLNAGNHFKQTKKMIILH